MSPLGRGTFCQCSSAELVVRVVIFCFTYDGLVFLLGYLAVQLIYLLTTVGREEE